MATSIEWPLPFVTKTCTGTLFRSAKGKFAHPILLRTCRVHTPSPHVGRQAALCWELPVPLRDGNHDKQATGNVCPVGVLRARPSQGLSAWGTAACRGRHAGFGPGSPTPNSGRGHGQAGHKDRLPGKRAVGGCWGHWELYSHNLAALRRVSKGL